MDSLQFLSDNGSVDAYLNTSSPNQNNPVDANSNNNDNNDDDMSAISSHSMVNDSILDTVYLTQKLLVEKPKVSEDNSNIVRCTVCTLPLGTCEHSRDWLNKRMHDRFAELEGSYGDR